MPTAIQVRVLGAKVRLQIYIHARADLSLQGLLLLDPNHRDSDEPIVHLRPSQVKIKFPRDFALEDPAHLTIDVLRAAHMKCGVRLSREMVRQMDHKHEYQLLISPVAHQSRGERCAPSSDRGHHDEPAEGGCGRPPRMA